QTETEATGAPQKHHYTLNQQVGSITIFDALTSPVFILISTAGKIFDSGDFSFNLISAYYVIQRIKDII
ncbi:hypothetical protein, partial [Klebsiella pneumoniae]